MASICIEVTAWEKEQREQWWLWKSSLQTKMELRAYFYQPHIERRTLRVSNATDEDFIECSKLPFVKNVSWIFRNKKNEI